MALDFYVNYWAVIIAAVVSFFVSWIWYGPLFGNMWMRLSGYTKKNMTKDQKKGMGGKMVTALIAQLAMAFVVAVLISSIGISEITDVIFFAFLLWLGLIASIMIGSVLWDGKPMALFWLNSVHWLVIIEIMALIVSSWR